MPFYLLIPIILLILTFSPYPLAGETPSPFPSPLRPDKSGNYIRGEGWVRGGFSGEEIVALNHLITISGQNFNLQPLQRGGLDRASIEDATVILMDIRRNWDKWSPEFREIAGDYFLSKSPLTLPSPPPFNSLPLEGGGIEPAPNLFRGWGWEEGQGEGRVNGEGDKYLSRVANLSSRKIVRERHLLPNWVETANFSIEWGNNLSSSDSGTDSDRILDCSKGPPCTGIPDIVDKWANYFEEVWTAEIDGLGYIQPTGTETYLYDVYIANTQDVIYDNGDDETPTLSSAYLGLTATYCDNEVCKGDVATSYSYIVVNNDFRDTGKMMTTAAHEFFHAIQFSYPTIDYWFYPESIWWIEATATWMEEAVHDNINNYYLKVKNWLSDPSLSLKNSGSHSYGDVIFIVFLTEVYTMDKDLIRYVWESGNWGIDAIDSVLNSNYNSDFVSAFKGFVALNAVADRSGPWGGYEEGAQYGSAAVTRINNNYPVLFSEVSGVNAPQELGTSYTRFLPPDNYDNRLIIEFDGASGVNWATMVVKVKSDGSGFETGDMSLNSSKYGCYSIDGFGTDYSEVFLVAAVLIDPALSDSAPYYYRASINGVCENTIDAYLIEDEDKARDKSDNGPCFIATAAFGSAESPYVQVLRDFRDKYLTPYSLGRKFVRIYYTVSPFIADFIMQHPPAAFFVRIALLPPIGIAFLFIKITLFEKIALIIVVLFLWLKHSLRSCMTQKLTK